MQQTWEKEFKNNYAQLNDIILNLSGIKIIKNKFNTLIRYFYQKSI